jgi:ankyrin repeat protein
MSISDAGSPRKRLPIKPSQEHLRKQAKRLAKTESIPLARAQHTLALQYGAKHWAELMHVVETMLRGADQLAYVTYDMEALPKAANVGDIEQIRTILATGEFTQHDLDLALARSALRFNERGAIARLLLEHGADPDGQYGSDYGPIVFVTGESLDIEGLQFLIDAGADVTFGPIDTKYGKQCPLSYWLGTYVRGRNDAKHKGIDILLKHGAYIPPEVTPEILAIHRGDATLLGEMLDADRALLRKTYPDMPYGNILLAGATLLHCAVEFGEIDCIDAILTRYRSWGDLDMNFRAEVTHDIGGQTPIFHAINTNGDGNFHVLQYLIQRVGQHIDLGIRATWRDSVTGPQTTPLTPLEYAEKAKREIDPKWAHFRPRVEDEIALLRPLDRRATIRKTCEAGDIDAVRTMLDEHPELLTPDLWPGAIFKSKSIELTKLLLDRGLDPNQCSAPRRPLHLACYQVLPEIVELLIERGANVNDLNPLDERPMDVLAEYPAKQRTPPDAGILRIRDALRRAGAAYEVVHQTTIGRFDSPESDIAFQLLDAAVPAPGSMHKDGRLDRAAELLAQHPDLSAQSIFVAACVGDADAVEKHLKFDSQQAKLRSGPRGWSPLLYLCFSRFLRDLRDRSDEFARCAKLLLDRGADANDYWLDGRERECALYGAAGISNCAPVTRVLIDAGAKVTNPPDHETLYHVCEHVSDHECLKLVLGAKPNADSLGYCLCRKLDYDDFDGMMLILEAGADPNHGHPGHGKNALHWALLRGRDTRFFSPLIERGANLNHVDKHGNTPLAYALQLGRHDVAELLRGAGASQAMTDRQRFFAACSAGDVETARGLLASISPADHPAITHAAAAGNLAGVLTMLDLGFPIDTRGEWNGTALHHALLAGRTAVARLLVDRGASLTARHAYDSDALGCALYAHSEAPSESHAGQLKWIAGLYPHDRVEADLAWHEREGNPQTAAVLRLCLGRDSG